MVKQHALAVREIRKPSFERSASRVKYLRINLHFVFHGLHQTGEKFRTHADAIMPVAQWSEVSPFTSEVAGSILSENVFNVT